MVQTLNVLFIIIVHKRVIHFHLAFYLFIYSKFISGEANYNNYNHILT